MRAPGCPPRATRRPPAVTPPPDRRCTGHRRRTRRRRSASQEPEPRGPARLDVSDLVVSFGGLLAVDKVSLSVEPGTIVGLIGANGSGKTTLLDTVSGMVTPTEGLVAARRRGPRRLHPRGAGRAGPRPLVPGLPPLPRADGAGHPDAVRGRPAHASASCPPRCSCPGRGGPSATSARPSTASSASFGLERFRHHLTGHLSTGTRRVVDLASIVLAGPRLLLLDEPTAGIAQREAEAFIPLLRQLQEVTGATILLVEHDVPLVFELCSTVIVMQTGTGGGVGHPRRRARDPRALAAYLGASDAALNVTGPVRATTDRTRRAAAHPVRSDRAGRLGLARARWPVGAGGPGRRDGRRAG